MWIDFEKWHGCLNDFIVAWASDPMIIESLKRQAQKLCKRDGSSIGADGVLILRTRHERDHVPSELIVVNQDGSIAKNCGNGLRCAALSVYTRNASEGEKLEGVSFQLAGRQMDCRFLTRDGKGTAGELPFVAVTMGEAALDDDVKDFKEIEKFVRSAFQQEAPKTKLHDVHFCQLGNPHLIFALEKEMSTQDAERIGRCLQSSPFWDGVNAHFIWEDEVKANLAGERSFLNKSPETLYRAIPYERGVGLTQACGSGAAAIGAAVLRDGFSERNDWLLVKMPGGLLYVKQDSEEDPVTLAGPAALAFTGKLEI